MIQACIFFFSFNLVTLGNACVSETFLPTPVFLSEIHSPNLSQWLLSYSIYSPKSDFLANFLPYSYLQQAYIFIDHLFKPHVLIFIQLSFFEK